MAESDIPPVLEKENQSEVESSDTVQVNRENEPANGLRSCSGLIEEMRNVLRPVIQRKEWNLHILDLVPKILLC